MKIIERVVKSAGSPGDNDLWLKEEGDNLSLKAHHNGSWRTVVGGGESGGSDSGSKRSVLDDAYFVDLGYINDGDEWIPYFTQEGLQTYADIVENVMGGVVPEIVYFTHAKSSTQYLRSELEFYKPITYDGSVVYAPRYYQNNIQNDAYISLEPMMDFPELLRLIAELIPVIEAESLHVVANGDGGSTARMWPSSHGIELTILSINGDIHIVSPGGNFWSFDIDNNGVVESVMETDKKPSIHDLVITVERSVVDQLIGKQVMNTGHSDKQSDPDDHSQEDDSSDPK